MRGPLCDGWPIHDAIFDPAIGRDLRRRREQLVRPGGVAQRRPRRDVDATPARASPTATTARRSRRSGTSPPAPTRCTPASSRRACSGAATAAQRGQHVEGLTNHPTPARVAAGQRRPDPPLDRPPPHRRGPGVGRHLGGRRVRDDATAAGPGRPATRACAPTSTPRTRTRSSASASTSSSWPPTAASCLYQQNHCGVYRSADGGKQWQEITEGPADRSSASRWAPIRATRRRSGRSR